MNTRRLVLTLLALVLAAACGSTPAPAKFKQKMVILGFDGMDPRLVEKWMGEGKLPNFQKLASQGGFYRLQTSTSPESPTSWASFAIGGNAAKHNIFDFLVRDVKTYVPDLGMVRREMPEFFLNYVPLGRPKITTLRGGTSFWVTAGQAGVRSAILTVPITFPPEDVPAGELLSGLPLPDIRGTVGTFSYFATDLSRYEEGNTEQGGILKRLVFEGDTAQSEIVGAPNPIIQAQMAELRKKGATLGDADHARMVDLEAKRDVRVPFGIRWNREAKSATIEVQGTTVHLNESQWSKWVPLEFRVNFLIRLYGMTQFFLVRANGELQLYMSPVNWRPESPVMPISSPASLSKDLYERLGTYRTLGWAEATWPLNEDRIDEKTFMDDLFRAFDDRAQVILHEVDSKKFDLVIGVLESTDRVQHMFWRFIDPTHPMYDPALAAKYGDSIERVYRRCDQLLGDVLARIEPDTLVFVMSDHGFHSFKYGVNLNTWLVENGYIARPGREVGAKNLNDMFGGGGQFWENVDWTRTRAYSLGLGQIYFNMKGREGQGIVNPGEDYKRLADELSARLLTMTDPKTGQRIVSNVYKRDDVYAGPYIANAPDLQVGFVDGYRVSWQTSLGGSPAGLLYPNMKKWSGDHCSFDYQTIPGSLLSNRRLTADQARIIDIAPTVLKYFGVGIPKEIDGKPLF
ncbi:MAG TPA: alkaline phosphatase family protein [Vicinamibacterales bacterium]|jgi:predicted AlkP superfamily phosphohydrolase/phosphomutase